MYPTVGQVLELPVVRRGLPRVVAGAGGLDRRVRWVHAAELVDIAHLLRGGELVLTTGIALPSDEPGLTRYVDELASVGAAGVVIELVRRWSDRLPPAMVAAAERRSLPLITLARETRYVAVTEAIGSLIVDAQVTELRAAEQVHRTFTELTVSGAEPGEILREVARASGQPVVLETLTHHVLGYDAAGEDAADLLADWESRSARVATAGRTGYDEAAGWLVTVVGARGDDWGRLVLVCPGEPTHRQIVVAERGASALALHRLVARDRDSIERQTHRTLLSELLAGTPPAPDLPTRAAALGVPLLGRQLIGVAIRPSTLSSTTPTRTMAIQGVLRDLAEASALAAQRAEVAALVGVVDDLGVRALVSLPVGVRADSVLPRLAREVHTTAAARSRVPPVVIGVGTVVDGHGAIAQAHRTLAEADHVAESALSSPGGRSYHRLDDVRLRGLLHLMRDDPRVTAFVRRELGPLLADGSVQNQRLLDVLRGYCAHGGNKSAAAAAAHLSRPAYYKLLARIEQLLGVSLNDPESVLSLHAALLALDSAR